MRLRADNPHLAKAITIHPSARRSPLDTDILKSVAMNGKMGKGSNLITKGKWAGMPMFQMSLEERATCTRDCEQWANCFANSMPFAHRIDHTHPEFLPKLTMEIALKAKMYRHGFVVRPHCVGDYYSPDYAQFWMDQAKKHKALHLFGYTHHRETSPIGAVIANGNESERVWIRFSDQGGPMSANVEGEGIPCPEQTKKTDSCLTCGLCWGTTRAISFKEH